jgi:Protein-tyrosine phosphatase
VEKKRNNMAGKCTHTTFCKIGKVAGNAIVLGAGTDLEDYLLFGNRPWLVLDLLGREYPPTKMEVSLANKSAAVETDKEKAFRMGLQKLKATTQWAYNRIHIDWRDGGIPSYPVAFWTQLADLIRANKNAGPVFIHCMGGHGRTGTAAAILSHIFGFSAGACPITFLRKKYCESAVETKAQVWYVGTMTGLELDVEGSNAWTSYNNTQPVQSQPLWPTGDTATNESGQSSLTGKSIVVTTPKEVYDNLSWSHQLSAYVDKTGELIGTTFREAVDTLKARMAKETK